MPVGAGRPVRAVQVGGPLGSYVPASQLDMPMDYETFAAAGAPSTFDPFYASDGETFRSEDPFTEEAWAEVPSGGTDDVDRAVRAARRAFDEGPWPRMTGAGARTSAWAACTSPRCPRRPLSMPTLSFWAPARIPGRPSWQTTKPVGLARFINRTSARWR